MADFSAKQFQELNEAYVSMYRTEETQEVITEEVFDGYITDFVNQWVEECIEEGIDISQCTEEQLIEAIHADMDEVGYLTEIFGMPGAQNFGANLRKRIGGAVKSVGDKVGGAVKYGTQVVKDTARGLQGQGVGANANTGSRLANLGGRLVSSTPRAVIQGVKGQDTKSRNPVAQVANKLTQKATGLPRALGAAAYGLATGKTAGQPKVDTPKTPATPATPKTPATPATPAPAAPASQPKAEVETRKIKKPSDGAERRIPTMRELRAAQAARAAGKSEKDVVQAGIAAGKKSAPPVSGTQTTFANKTPAPVKKSRLDTALSGIGKWSEEKEAYDVVLEYLLSGGHAETVEEAHYVMLEMDTETIKNICEEVQEG